MTPEIDWLFDVLEAITSDIDVAFGTVADVPDGTAPVQRVNRTASTIEDNVRRREGDLQRSNFIGAALVDDPTEPAGSSHNRREAIVAVRVEGLDHSRYGHIDPAGVEGVPFGELYGAVVGAVQDNREYPDVGRERVAYQTAFAENRTNRSAEYHDFYDYRFDVRLRGYEDIP